MNKNPPTIHKSQKIIPAMAREYPLLFDESEYADLAREDYSFHMLQWMAMESVPAKAIQMMRSKKKLDELYRKKVFKEGDTWTMKKTGKNGNIIVFSATVRSKSSVLPSGANTGFNLTD